MITRFRIPVSQPARITATSRPSVSMPPLLLFIEVEMAEHDVKRGVTLLRARVPVEGCIVETPWTYLANDIAVPLDRLRGFLTFQAWEQYRDWREAQAFEYWESDL